MNLQSVGFVFHFSEYTTFLSLPVNATQVHIINQAPLFTHMGELHHEDDRFMFSRQC